MNLRLALTAAAMLGALGGCARAPPPAARVQTAVEVGTLGQSTLIVGRDVGYSAQVWGHGVWAFGDTFLAVPNASGTNFVSNTFDVSDGSSLDGGLVLQDRLDDAGAPEELLTPTPEEAAYDLAHRAGPDGGCAQAPCGGRWATWPGPTLFDADSGTALTFYSLVTAAPGDFNFSAVGESLAVWRDFAGRPARPEPTLCAPSPTLLFCQAEPAYGSAATLSQGEVYAFAKPGQLARAPFDQALNKGAWEYWDGSAWTTQGSSVASLFGGASIMGLFFNPYVNAWMLIYAVPLSNQVVLRTAPALTGPWSGEGNLFVADRKGTGGNTYDALPHPEWAEDNGRIQYVTFSRSNGTVFGSEFAVVRVTFQ